MRLVLSILLFSFLGCSSALEQSELVFDTKSFFLNEANRLSNNKVGLIKHLRYNTETDSIFKGDSVNWQDELQSFIQIDLAKPSYKKSYATKRIELNNEAYQIEYVVKDSLLKIKRVLISFNSKDSVESIAIHTKKENSYYNQLTHLTYNIHNGYYIETTQQTLKMDSTLFAIKCEFTRY